MWKGLFRSIVCHYININSNKVSVFRIRFGASCNNRAPHIERWRREVWAFKVHTYESININSDWLQVLKLSLSILLPPNTHTHSRLSCGFCLAFDERRGFEKAKWKESNVFADKICGCAAAFFFSLSPSICLLHKPIHSIASFNVCCWIVVVAIILLLTLCETNFCCLVSIVRSIKKSD